MSSDTLAIGIALQEKMPPDIQAEAIAGLEALELQPGESINFFGLPIPEALKRPRSWVLDTIAEKHPYSGHILTTHFIAQCASDRKPDRNPVVEKMANYRYRLALTPNDSCQVGMLALEGFHDWATDAHKKPTDALVDKDILELVQREDSGLYVPSDTFSALISNVVLVENGQIMGIGPGTPHAPAPMEPGTLKLSLGASVRLPGS